MKINNYPNWLVPIETAEKLKEIDFDEPCHTFIKKGDDYIQCCTNDFREHLVIHNSKLITISDEFVSRSYLGTSF
jgi:hypothetical protein|nr:MAG TPA: hypothetical protein [Caudoviricetes sp.]